ncbi:MAG: hypothetical protein WA885_16795 [Phormidesmis sp.]
MRATSHQIIQNRIGIVLILLALAFGFFTRVIAVFQYVTFDIGPDPDQIRDAFTVMEIWQGDFPTLGPKAYGAGLGGFHILPLYYYLFFPFTLIGRIPALQAFPNALFSFLSIPLFILLIYRLLEGVSAAKRLCLSSLSGLWYSFLFNHIFISNFQWNPSSIPFFFMGFTLFYDLQMRHLFNWKVQTLAWIGSGLCVAILMSLHATTLFIIPVIYVIASLRFIFKVLKEKIHKKDIRQLALPGLGWLAAAVALTPYWAGELGRNFSNSKAILKTLNSATGKSESNVLISIFTRLGDASLHALDTVRQAYFWSDSAFYLIISAIAIALITSAALFSFKGNSDIWFLWLTTWGLFLLAATSLEPGETVLYYKILVSIAPIALTVVAIAYVRLSGKTAIAYGCAIALFILLSSANNLYRDAQFMAAKYGPNRLLNTQEIVQIMQQLPAGSKICDPRIERKRSSFNQYNYIDTYLTQRNIETLSNCQTGNYIIHSKRVLAIAGNFLNTKNYQDPYMLKEATPPTLELWPILKTVKNEDIARPAIPILEIQTAYLYRLP